MDDTAELAREMGDALRAALASRDPEGLRRFLSPDVIWGDEGYARTCHGPDEVIEFMRAALGRGVDASVGEITAGSRGVVAAIEVEFPGEARMTRFQVYGVDDGLVTQIHGFDDEASARAAAGVA
ncbi:MAG TPA: nuclear transport factor 2 family protein [Acidimicrobiales bacterium]|nr:nuclear transport factor 2 family protein [Acidimicrobiales bacterium]